MTPEALARRHADAFPDERGWSAAEFSDLLSGPGALLVTHGASVVLGRLAADEAEILTLLTEPAARRQGHARAALVRFEAEARDHGVRSVFLEVAADNAAARALYAGAGYCEVGRRLRYYQRADGAAVDALTLRKTLAD